jgi:transposase
MRAIRVLPLQHQASGHLICDRGRLQREVLQHRDRIRKLLVATRWPESVHSRKFASRLAGPLPEGLHKRLARGCERLALAEAQLTTLEKAVHAHGREQLLDALAGYWKLHGGELMLDGTPVEPRFPRHAESRCKRRR